MAFEGSVSYVEYAAEEPWQSAEQLQHVPLRPSHSDLDACPSRPLPLSPVAPQTESEPEAELYPESGCSTPRQGRVMQSQPFPLPLVQPLSGVAFQGAAERPLPAPAAARRTGLPRQEAAREDNYAAVHGSGKVLMLYASPLCRLDASFGGPVPMPPLPFEREWEEVVLTPHGEAQHLRSRPAITLAASCLTAGSLQKALVRGTPGGGASILHISAHGAGGGLVLEDGRGTAHLLSCELLRGLLALRQEAVAESSNNNNNGKSCPRLVILNACNSQPAGLCFAESGVPHVVCTASDTRDSWSRLFLRTLYACLFQGSSDFLGRSLDVLCPNIVWSILQHLAHRRVIVLCNGGGAVHRSAALRLGTCCVAVQMGVRGCASWPVSGATKRAAVGAAAVDVGEVQEVSGALMFAAGAGSAGGVLLLLHGCDHLVQQQPVQEILAELLRRCPACRIVLSSRARMVGPGSGHFKVVHHELRGLEAQDAARLFLRRAQRPLTWAELRPSSAPSEILPPGLGPGSLGHLQRCLQHSQTTRKQP
ncbi:unnamed protein product [Polarella glacialis]|uniref:CHAT domain-containing protein n=1 Tax=Polarella glacialis TaxID=89957 RepID=A0A813LRT8_POLGL|nr:unnamed protein product [Polarella glacialis]